MLAHHVGQKAHEARTLDGAGQLTLLLGRNGRDAAGHNLATLGNEASEKLDVLVVNLRRAFTRERAALAAAEEWTTRAAL